MPNPIHSQKSKSFFTRPTDYFPQNFQQLEILLTFANREPRWLGTARHLRAGRKTRRCLCTRRRTAMISVCNRYRLDVQTHTLSPLHAHMQYTYTYTPTPLHAHMHVHAHTHTHTRAHTYTHYAQTSTHALAHNTQTQSCNNPAYRPIPSTLTVGLTRRTHARTRTHTHTHTHTHRSKKIQ